MIWDLLRSAGARGELGRWSPRRDRSGSGPGGSSAGDRLDGIPSLRTTVTPVVIAVLVVAAGLPVTAHADAGRATDSGTGPSATVSVDETPADVGIRSGSAPSVVPAKRIDNRSDSESASMTTDAKPADFGYDSVTVNGREARGDRPLLVVLLDFRDRGFDGRHPRSYYERMFTNVSEYYTENSRGRFTWKPTVVGPFVHRDDPSTDVDESLFNCAKVRPPKDGKGGCPGADDDYYESNSANEMITEAIQLAEKKGDVNFAEYDRNDDGVVMPDELGIVLVSAEPKKPSGDFPRVKGASGGTRSAVPDPCVDVEDVHVCPPFVRATEWTNITTHSHELGHMLGAGEAYGANSRLNPDLTIMDGTIGEDETYHFDPWQKIQFGWVKPRIYNIDDLRTSGTCAFLNELRDSGPLDERDTRRPIVLYDTDRYDTDTRTGEYYIVEHRNRASYDSDIPENRGLAIWYVHTENGSLVKRPSKIGPKGSSKHDDGNLNSDPDPDDVLDPRGKSWQIHAGHDGVLDSTVATGPDGKRLDSVATDQMNFNVDPGSFERGAPANYSERGDRWLWNEKHGEITLRWFDGERLAFPLEITGYESGSLVLDLNADRMRIDPDASSTNVEPGASVTLGGHVGSQFADSGTPKRVNISGGSVSRSLTVSPYDWQCNRVSVRIPPDVPTGKYQLWVQDPATGTTSNHVDLVLRERVEDDAWPGTYGGSLDGHDARISIDSTPGDEFNYDVELVDSERGVTYTGHMSATSSNVVEDVELRSPRGRTVTIDRLVLHREEYDHLSGRIDLGGRRAGLAFSHPDDWYEGGGPPLDTSDPETWRDQWTGEYDGYLDGRRARLTVSGGEHVEYGATRPGEGYRFEIELEDLERDVTYRGTGTIDVTDGRAQLQLLEIEELTSSEGSLDVAQFRLHEEDTSIVSGSATVGEDDPGYGPKSERIGFHFSNGKKQLIDPEIARIILTVGWSDADGFDRQLTPNDRINIEVPEGARGIAIGGSGRQIEVRTAPYEDPTLEITVSKRAMARLRTVENPEPVVAAAFRNDEIQFHFQEREGQSADGIDVNGDGSVSRDGTPSDDGLHQDVNGDGSVTLEDVQALVDDIQSQSSNARGESVFDFDGDQTVDIRDARVLSELVSNDESANSVHP